MRGRLARVAPATMQAACLSRDRAEGVGKRPSRLSPDRSSRIDNVLDRWAQFPASEESDGSTKVYYQDFPSGTNSGA